MDEFDGPKGSQREPVRSSMVVMTGKLLGVTESIAAMNLRIFCGVVFCIILLVATFVVNVVAFDYAKDTKGTVVNEYSGNKMMVDKDSGNPMDVHVGTVPQVMFAQTASFENLRNLKEIDVQFASAGFGHYMIGGAEELPCPKGDETYCQGDSLLVLYATTGQTIYVKNDDGDEFPKARMLRDSSVLEKAVAESDVINPKTRHLLQSCASLGDAMGAAMCSMVNGCSWTSCS